MHKIHRHAITLNTKNNGTTEPLSFSGTIIGPISVTPRLNDAEQFSVVAVVDTGLPASYLVGVFHTGSSIDSDLLKNYTIVHTQYAQHVNQNGVTVGYTYIIFKLGAQPKYTITMKFNSNMSSKTAGVLINGCMYGATGKVYEQFVSDISISNLSYQSNGTTTMCELTCTEDFFMNHYGALCIELNQLPSLEAVTYKIGVN